MSEFSADGDGLSWCMSDIPAAPWARLASSSPDLRQELQQNPHTSPDCSIERLHGAGGGTSCGFRLTRQGRQGQRTRPSGLTLR